MAMAEGREGGGNWACCGRRMMVGKDGCELLDGWPQLNLDKEEDVTREKEE
jgi:hypothetical protein